PRARVGQGTALLSRMKAAHQAIQLSRPSPGPSRRISLPVVNSHEQAGSSSSFVPVTPVFPPRETATAVTWRRCPYLASFSCPVPRRAIAPSCRGLPLTSAHCRDVASPSALARPPGSARGQLGIYRLHRSSKGRELEISERRHYYPLRVKVERLRGDPLDQGWLQIDVKPVEAPAPAHLARSAGRH